MASLIINPSSENHVKRRINQFFGNILRKDKVQLEDQEDSTSSTQAKKKQKNKDNQSYSQWDLMENIAGEPSEDELSRPRNRHDENMIYSDGLAYYADFGETLQDFNDAHMQLHTDEQTGKKRRSFLKRSGSLLRRSLRRSKKQSKNEENVADLKGLGIESVESLSHVVQEINTVLLEVETFGRSAGNSQTVFSGVDLQQRVVNNSNNNTPVQNGSFFETNEIFPENNSSYEQRIDDEWSQQGKKGLKNGLKRQASKLASKFQRTPGSVRLKSTVSIESFPSGNRNRSASFSTPNSSFGSGNPDLGAGNVHKRTESFKRTLSFKQAKKVMRKGVTSFGKSMMHASAVMPIAYESPPVTFYPDYENDEYPQHLVQCYYRTISYQQKDCNNSLNDKHGHYARPTSFYQHGYCYNG